MFSLGRHRAQLLNLSPTQCMHLHCKRTHNCTPPPGGLLPYRTPTAVDGGSAWSPRLSSAVAPAYACVCISSNRWPGAHAFAQGKQWGHVYIGWGIKFTSEPYRLGSCCQPPLAADAPKHCGTYPNTATARRYSHESQLLFRGGVSGTMLSRLSC